MEASFRLCVCACVWISGSCFSQIKESQRGPSKARVSSEVTKTSKLRISIVVPRPFKENVPFPSTPFGRNLYLLIMDQLKGFQVWLMKRFHGGGSIPSMRLQYLTSSTVVLLRPSSSRKSIKEVSCLLSWKIFQFSPPFASPLSRHLSQFLLRYGRSSTFVDSKDSRFFSTYIPYANL